MTDSNIPKRFKAKLKTPPTSQSYQNIKVNSELLKEAQKKAHSIVLKLLKVRISKEFLSKNLCFINSEHFEDVAVERAIIGICGYPLCDATISDKKYENQNYVIRHNKVYDVTQRRNFCSDKCFEAWEFICHQIPSIPLYLRSTDDKVLNLKVIIPDLASLKGKVGKHVNITGTEFDSEDLLKSKQSANKENHHPSSDEKPKKSLATITEDSQGEDADHELLEETQKLSLKEENKHKSLKNKKALQSHLDSGKIKIKNDQKKLRSSKMEDILEIENNLREWMTFESLRLILGDVYVKGMLDHMGKIWEDYGKMTSESDLSTIDFRTKYVAFCKKLDKEEVKENLLDAEALAETDITEADEADFPLRPVPNYEELKEDVEELSLKVKAFYEASEEFGNRQGKLETILEEGSNNNDKASKSNKTKKRVPQEVNVDSGTLPLIDMYSQKTWRRQIVSDKLAKRLSELSLEFGLDEREIRRLAITLITTFDLSSKNICFTNNQWKFVALVIIKMLSVRYPPIGRVFIPGEEGHRLVVTHLREQGLDEEYLTRLLSYLTNMSYILSKCDAPFKDVIKDNDSSAPKEFKMAPQNSKDIKNSSSYEEERISTNFEELD